MNNKLFKPIQQRRQQALRLYFPTIYCALLFAWCLIQQNPGGSKGCIDCQACLYDYLSAVKNGLDQNAKWDFAWAT